MGRHRTGSVYRNRQGKLRYKYVLHDGIVWDKEVPPPEDGGPSDEKWGALFLAFFRRRVEAGWDPRNATPEVPSEKPTPTTGEHVASWIKAQTYDQAARDVKILEMHFAPSALASLLLIQVKPRHCLDYVKWLKERPSQQGGTLAPRSVCYIAGLIQRAFAQAVRDELLNVTPWNLPPNALPSLTDKVIGARETWIFTLEEVQQLCYSELLTQERRAMYATLFLGCCRSGEMVALRVKDWDRTKKPLGSLHITKSRSSAKKTIKGTKTNVSRLVPVHPALAAILAEWLLSGLPQKLGRPLAEEDLFFPSRQTKQERAQHTVWEGLRADLKRLGLRHRRVHDTRRTHISMLVDADARREVFSVWTHGKKQDVISSYTTEAWKTLCAELLKIEFSRPTPQAQGLVVNLAIDNAIAGEEAERKAVLREEKSVNHTGSIYSMATIQNMTGTALLRGFLSPSPDTTEPNPPLPSPDNAIGIAKSDWPWPLVSPVSPDVGEDLADIYLEELLEDATSQGGAL